MMRRPRYACSSAHCSRRDVRRKLEQQARGRSTAARVVLRSRIVLLAADGLQNKQIARRT